MDLTHEQLKEAQVLCKERREIQLDIERIFQRVEDRKKFRKEGVLKEKAQTGGVTLSLNIPTLKLCVRGERACETCSA